MAETTPSTPRGFMDFSPTRKDNANKENDASVLSLVLFSKAPFVTFGTVKLGTSKSAVLRIENPTEDAEAEVAVDKVPTGKGFSVDCNTFTVQPLSSFNLTITWTPTEEGGIRELVIFSANGVLKHQAVLLGRAEAPKQKKRSLWDTIKNKRGDGKVGMHRGKRTEAPLKMAANKTLQVSRKAQYKREKPRSPLASINAGKAVRECPIIPGVFADQKPTEEPKALPPVPTPLTLSHQENSPLVPVVPASKVTGVPASSDSLTGKPVNKDMTRMLNKTLSPLGTPERFRKLMPRIQAVEKPCGVKSASDTQLANHPRLSLKDALVLIDSDLSASPRDASSTGCFSDSLDSVEADKAVVKAFPVSPELAESNEARLTFFVNKKMVVPEAEAVEPPKKTSFNSATVTKGKALLTENPSSGRKIKKSRRRLMENTLELGDGGRQDEPGPTTPRLPVIDVDTSEDQTPRVRSSLGLTVELTSCSPTPTPITFPVTSPPPHSHFTFPVTSPLPAVSPCTAFTSALPLSQSSPLPGNLAPSQNKPSPTVCQPKHISVPLSMQEQDVFPIHVVGNSKKRKSEEYLKSDGKIQDTGKTEQVKRTKVVVGKSEPVRSKPDRRSVSQRQQIKVAGSVRSTSSLRSTRSAAPAPGKHPSCRLASRGAVSLKLSGPPSVKTAKVVAVAHSKLSFITPAPTAIPRHPLPFAAKNMFFDERWIEKQERGFTWWLNYVLTPDDFKVTTEVTKVSAASLAMGCTDQFSVPKAPTKEEMSFSTYTARRKLNRLRRAACQLFTSEAMVRAIQKLELEVEAKRLLIRKDRHLWKDIGERQKVLNWLLSYNPLWLRIGLETIYGELISLESNSDALGLAMFILQRLLWNPDIAAEFRHAKVPHLYKDGHEEALSRFTLKKLLLLVCFLDKAKESRLIEHDPCLFCMDAEFKTSKDLLLAFSRDFLSGEGILPRHLGYLGLPVSHVQKPLDEFNYAVKNLSADLKCGIRLVRVMELLIQQWDLSAKLRLPAISRLQKVHNVDVTMHVLRAKGVDLKDEHGSVIDSRDVVDGHREKTLSLLWKIIFAFQVEVILDEDQLREEIVFLRRAWRTKRKLASLRADCGPRPCPVKSTLPYDHSSPKVSLLMDWVRAVCDFYALKAENFTVTFSDGRVLCYLIHHYHPSLLRHEAVSHSTTQTVECSSRGRLELSGSGSDSDTSFDSPLAGSPSSVEFKELLENEKNNFRLVSTAVSSLGGVPAMMNPADMSNTIPNEKVVISYLTFLCARLLDLRNETRAARVIQGAWRKYRLKKDLQLYEERNAAAVKLQLLVRSFLQRRRARRQNESATIIQSAWRGYAARRRLRLAREAQLRAAQHRAAALIQAQWRMVSARSVYRRLRRYTIVVQAQWRMRRAASAFGRVCRATAAIQSHFRAWILARQERERYLSLRSAAVKIQRGFRRWKSQQVERENRAATVIQATFRKWYERRLARRTAAAVRIQSWYRRCRCLRQYRRIKTSTLLIQAQYRGHAQRRRFQRLQLQHRSAVVIQSAVRGHAVRQRLARRTDAAVVIQRWFRASVRRDADRQRFLRMRRAAKTLQAAYRRKAARDLARRRHTAATVIQAAYRKQAARRSYLLLRTAAAAIQNRYRATMVARKTKGEYEAFRNAVLTIQAHWRGRTDRRRIEKYHRCATLIGAYYRRHKVQSEFRSTKAAAVVIQRRLRAYVSGKEAREAYVQKRAACVVLQAAFRGLKARTELRKRHEAAVAIQSSVRMLLTRKRYVVLRSAVVIVQSRYRALLLCRAEQRKYKALKKAASTIQAVYRGFRVRHDLWRRRNAATAIQAQFRMYRMRMTYLAFKCAAVIIQERYRAKLCRDELRQRFISMRSAAVVIQAAYRGHRVRMEVAEMHRAAAIIQRRFLTTQERKRFLAIKAAALTCQQRCRAVAVTRRQRLDYLSKRRAAICLQAACRGHVVRKQLRVMRAAAVTIQCHYRRHQERASYQRLRWAAGVLQARYRANKRRRQEQHELSTKRSAVVVLQAAFRGMKSRRVEKLRHQAASVVQRAYRAHRQRKKYRTIKSSVVTLQRRYRAAVAAKEQKQRYVRLRRAAVVLQAAFRGRQVRRDVARLHQAAAVIQSAFRRHRVEVKFQAMRLSAVIIQRYYRACVLRRQERDKFQKVRRSAVVLQAAFRGQRVRRRVAEMQRAAAVLQANVRRWKQQGVFRKQRWAACVLQSRFRAHRQRNVEVNKYLEARRAVLVLQAAYRGAKARRALRQKHQAASVVQRAFRTHRQQKKYRTIKSSVLTLQRWYRATVAAKEQKQRYVQMRRAAVVLQAAFRGQRVRRRVAEMQRAAAVIQANVRRWKQQGVFRKQRWAACVLQSRFRAHRQRNVETKHFSELRRAVVLLQAAYRGTKSRRCLQRRHRAASVIQRAFRTHRQQRRHLTVLSSVRTIQRKYRATLAANAQRKEYLQMRSAAVVLQAACRGRQTRRLMAHRQQAATVIQSAFRTRAALLHFQAMRASAVVIQASYRACRERRRFLTIQRSTVVLQAAFRGHRVRRDMRQRRHAASVIQANWRCSLQSRRFQQTREVAVTLQRRLRATRLARAQRTEYIGLRQAAVTLQTHCRGWMARRQVAEAVTAERRLRFTAAAFHHLSAMKIQRALRAHWALVSAQRQIHSIVTLQRRVRVRQQRRRYLEDLKRVVTAQRAVKRWIARRHEAASVLQQAVRSFLLLRRQERVRRGIVKAQALWRGHCSRRLNDNPKVLKLRHMLRKVSAGAREEDKLCNKTSSALDYLLRYKQFSYILEALKSLETTTRLSPVCCEQLVESGATSVIFTLIRCCNRSVPCMDVITYSTQILLNLSKYHRTLEAVYSVDKSVETLVDLLQRYRERAGDKVAEKGGSIFTKTCFLLVLLLQDKRHAVDVMKTPKVLDRICGIYRLTVRKHKMEAERNVTKQKMNASINGSFCVPATPRKCLPVPKFAPDWVLKKDKLKDVVDPLRAIKMLANTLSIVL